MNDLLHDPLNQRLIEALIKGEGVEVNISSLSRSFKKHRNTIKMHLNDLIEHGIIKEPAYSLKWVFQEYPLLVIVRSDLPRTDEVRKFVKEDMNIIGAFYVRNEEYNMLFIELHENLYQYEEWRDRIVKEKWIPPREKRYPANSIFFSNRKMIKYQPHSSISVIQRSFRKDDHLKINGLRMNSLSMSILKKLLIGEGIRTNENLLSKKLDVHRKTIRRRISTLKEEGILSKPTSMFPEWFIPPDYILVYYLVEARRSKSLLIKDIVKDPHIPMAHHANMGGYNLLLFGVFPNVESHFLWEEVYEKKFPGCFGRVKKIYLSPKMTTSLDIRKISLGILKKYSENRK
jgi:predicted transcriptional regulator/DNA-binding transcriptional ArsR family regulator